MLFHTRGVCYSHNFSDRFTISVPLPFVSSNEIHCFINDIGQHSACRLNLEFVSSVGCWRYGPATSTKTGATANLPQLVDRAGSPPIVPRDGTEKRPRGAEIRLASSSLAAIENHLFDTSPAFQTPHFCLCLASASRTLAYPIGLYPQYFTSWARSAFSSATALMSTLSLAGWARTAAKTLPMTSAGVCTLNA